ncbi:uncharacterized protein LOC126771694 isoform X2 [Nymphalis io]|uniref:uncharacterized protein LOC126771694 isoform X1 n=1 Tax=Inachis io TaxID=171585 RepID=UPI00216A6DC3|nr:uncharacterized protein LOC126771694 isoform X1 [Nymphalis io]XP_050347676.1 uncharacterized protein LOC126771694 isoform X2 [Nymphalis io]
MLSLIFAACIAVAIARPSYIAVPADQIAFLDLTALRARRVPRQTLAPPPPQLPEALYEDNYQPIPLQNYQQGTVALAPPPAPEAPARVQAQDGASSETNIGAVSQYAERPPDFGEYVDFGAHTGDNGAFGWYADYPVNNKDTSGYRK